MSIVPSVRSLVFGLVLLCMSAAAVGQVGIAIRIGPPPIPVYDQPVCPGDGYLWTPGYWAYDYDIDDYYWVPGTWVLAPEVGFLWTPGWWGWGGDAFIFHEGFWGPHIGFYGGINYGFGYFGVGFVGGEWRGGTFFYNTAVMRVDEVSIRNVYVNRTVIVNSSSHVAYNGGEGGVSARPTSEEEAAGRDRHVGPIAAQTQHMQAARGNPELRASANHGKPPIAATARPGEFSGRGAVPAREAGGAYTPPAGRGGTSARNNEAGARTENSGGSYVHPNDLPPNERPAAPNTGDAKLDKKYQKEQDKLIANQNKERQKLQQQQDREHQQMARQNAGDAQKQQMEQRHQQQTQQLQQAHVQQRQAMQTRQQPRHK